MIKGEVKYEIINLCKPLPPLFGSWTHINHKNGMKLWKILNTFQHILSICYES